MLCAPFYTMLCTCLVKTLYGINYNNNNKTRFIGITICLSISACKIPCLTLVTGFSSKLVFNLAEHPLYYSDQATHRTCPEFEPRTSHFRRKCSRK